nr:unnamed protein product [Callosobruchus analis]
MNDQILGLLDGEYTTYLSDDSVETDDEEEDDATSEFSTDKNKSVRDFICIKCNYATKKTTDFTIHWLTHEEQSYTSENGVFVCQISDCFYVAANEGNLLKHISHHHLHIYSCDFCYNVTYSKKGYDQHGTTHYTYQCVKCDIQSTKPLFVQDHSETPLKCKKCDFTTYHWFPYKKHTNWHNYPPESIVECEFCNFTTGDKSVLEKHNALHYAKLTHCKMCSFTRKNMTELSEHCENAHDTTLEALNKLHKCKFCTCKFIGLGLKEKHEELHFKMGALLKCCSNYTKIQCPYCNETLRDNMKSHILLKHAAELELENFRFENSSDAKFLKCSALQNLEACDAADDGYVDKIKPDPEQEDTTKCEEEITTPLISTDNFPTNSNSTRRHAPQNEQVEQEVEVKQSRNTCPFCYYNASSEDDYNVHYKTHATFKCKKCPLESTKQLFVEDHTDNPWGCPKCDFKAHHWLLLKSHSFSHQAHGLTLLKCRECSFETNIPSKMKSHSTIHATALLQCRICSFETRSTDVLRKHYSSRHNVTLLEDGSVPSVERPFECDLCACKFKEQVYLDKHKELHKKNGPFHLICRQCRQGRKVIKPDQIVMEKPDSWIECPYCSHEDEARYRMIQHLSRIHQSELQIEGYRFDDVQTHEIISQTSDIASLTSEATLPQMQGNPHTINPKNTDGGQRNCDSVVNTGKNEREEFRKKEQSKDAGEGSSSSETPGFILKHMSKEHGQPMFRCNVCGYRIKGKCIIEKHMDQKHPPYLTGYKESADKKILCCAGCSYTAKTKHMVKKHMLANHAIEEEEDGTAYFQIDKEAMEYMEEAEPNNSTETENTESLRKPIKPVDRIEEVLIKVEPTTFLEEESAEGTSSQDLSANVNRQLNLVPVFRETDKKWCCPVCPYNVTREHYVERHIKLGHKGYEAQTYFCTICPYKAQLKNSLRQHMERMHNPEGSTATSEQIPCKQPGCDFKAPTVDDLSAHMARHLQSSMQEVMVYKCELCNFGSVSKTIFRTHTMTCAGMPYWYQCYSCDFKSESKKGIMAHIDTKHRYRYTDKKGYECLKCGYSSRDKSWKEYHSINCSIKGEVE